VQEKLTTASSHLIFFTLELTKLDDAALAAGYERRSLAYYKPWIDDTLREKPYQLDDKLEQLLHEKSVTGRAAGTGCSMKRLPACVSTSTARNFRLSRRFRCFRTMMAASARRRRWR
jgi:hypothetical protein